MAKLISPGGEVTEVKPKNGKTFSLDEMYEYIGCSMVQFSDGKDGETLIFDEEFLCRGDIVNTPLGFALVSRDEDGNEVYKPWLNHTATRMMHPSMGPFVHNVICGNCLVCDESEVN